MKFSRHIQTGRQNADMDSTSGSGKPDPFELLVEAEKDGKDLYPEKRNNGSARICLKKGEEKRSATFEISSVYMTIQECDLPPDIGNSNLRTRLKSIISEMHRRGIKKVEFFLKDGLWDKFPPLLDDKHSTLDDDFFLREGVVEIAGLIFWFTRYQAQLEICKGREKWHCPSCDSLISIRQTFCHHQNCAFHGFYEACFGKPRNLEMIAKEFTDEELFVPSQSVVNKQNSEKRQKSETAGERRKRLAALKTSKKNKLKQAGNN